MTAARDNRDVEYGALGYAEASERTASGPRADLARFRATQCATISAVISHVYVTRLRPNGDGESGRRGRREEGGARRGGAVLAIAQRRDENLDSAALYKARARSAEASAERSLPRIRILDLPKAPKWAGPRTVWNEFGDIEVSGPPPPTPL